MPPRDEHRCSFSRNRENTVYPKPNALPDTLSDQFVTVGPHTRDGGVPAVGWARVAFLLHSLQPLSTATVIIELVDDERLVIDWGLSLIHI